MNQSNDSQHELYHEQTLELLAGANRVLSEIAIISSAMLGVFVVVSVVLIWILFKDER